MQQFNHILYKNPDLNYPRPADFWDFSAYISQCQNLIRGARVDLSNNPHAKMIINANSPYELNPQNTGKTGVLMLHGLYDSPFVVKDLGAALAAQGLLVRSVLLPGHGTVPGALLAVRYQEWLDTVEDGIQGLLNRCEKIFIVGFSTGASLALQRILEKKYSIAGLVLLAPAIKISPLSSISWLPPKLRSLSPSFEWFHTGCDSDYVRYQSFTYNSIYQVYLLSQTIKKLCQEMQKIPGTFLVAISQDDKTVDSNGTLDFFKRYANEMSQLILYTNRQKNLNDKRIIQRAANYPEWRIKNISHVSLPIAPDNLHYGLEGDYSGASHVQAQPKDFYVNNEDLRLNFLNWLHELGIYPYQYRRLSFNPDFLFLKEKVIEFVQGV